MSNIGYDKNGNITKLKREGVGNGLMDDLTYNYHDAGVSNRLQRVHDASGNTEGFSNGANTTEEYVYDDNGNMTLDRNKGITDIDYNHLNLPTQVDIGSGTISYIYDATGVKQKKIVSTGTNTEYCGNYIYENGDLAFFNHPEGYITPDGQGGYDYVYDYVDHLGNVRLSYTDSNDDGNITQNEIVKESNYYPFGLQHKGYNSNVSPLGNSVAKNYLFGGKELIQSLDLNLYDYHARMYDPAIGRMIQMDPHANDYPWASPYNYAFNNPVLVVDPDGKDGIVSGSGTEDDPYVVTANYYYYGLNGSQSQGLNDAISAFNNGGAAHKINDGDGNDVYVQYNLSATEAADSKEAIELAGNDVINDSEGNPIASFGNVANIGGSSDDSHFGQSTRFSISLNQEKVTSTLAERPGGDESSLITGTWIHEIGHNTGGSHGDTGSIMRDIGINEQSNGAAIGNRGTGNYNYSYPSVNSNGIRAIMGRVNMAPGSINSAYLSDRENRKVGRATNPGSTGRLYNPNN